MHSPARALSRLLTALALVLSGAAALAAPADAVTVGYKGPYYGVPAGSTGTSGVPGAPTAQKPQSKLWYAQGSWWAALWSDDLNNKGEAFTIHRYDWATNTWVDTGVKLDSRARSDMDVLWDGSHLYVMANGAAPPSANIPSPDVLVSRYSYSGGTWVADWASPVTITRDLVYSPVIDEDSTGLIWMTYTEGTQVMISHSVPGDDHTWVTPYQLPTPNGESTVSYDPLADPNQPSSDIASVVAYDGDKVGVLWSNQRTQKVYFASHTDGTVDTQWTTRVAFDQPKGADDHINLKSVIGTDVGRVYAVTKTSMTGTKPIIELLELRLDGTWASYDYASADTNLTRPILMLDPEQRDLYVFAAAGETPSSGGAIYYKKTSMVNPSFSAGRGTEWISDDALTGTDKRINNPTSTKQNVGAQTGLLVLASNDPTDYYYYNRMDLAPVDTMPPDTTIASGPAPSTDATTATFDFTSSEPGSTFRCQLDAAAAAPCTSPATYAGLAVGDHTFQVWATDATGNEDASPATASWTVTPPPDNTAPDTTITTATTTGTTASFEFTSSEPRSTFRCQLDAATAAPCTSPATYAGLAVGDHTFQVWATDATGNEDATPDTRTWTVQAPVPQPLFADDFSSGLLSNWSALVRGDAWVRVVTGAVHPGNKGAVVSSSKKATSAAVLSRNLGQRLTHLTLTWDAVIGKPGKTGQLSRLIRVQDGAGKALLSLLRKPGTRTLYLRDASGATWAVRGPAVGHPARMSLDLTQRASGTGKVVLRINSKTWRISARLGVSGFAAISFGDGRSGHALRYGIDDVELWR